MNIALENIKNIENYIDKPEDFKKILTNLTNNTNNFRGADWALQVVKEKPIVGKITGFEVKLNDAENFTADITAKQGNLEPLVGAGILPVPTSYLF